MNEKENKLILLEKGKQGVAIYTEADNKLIIALEERLQKAKNIKEYREIWKFLSEVKKDSLKLHYDTQQQQLLLNKQKTDLVLYKTNKGLTLLIGLGLFVSSFFIFQLNPMIGGIFFGTGLGALGIGTFSLKSIINK